MIFSSLINFLGFTQRDKIPISANRVGCTAKQHQGKRKQEAFEMTVDHFSIVVGVDARGSGIFSGQKKGCVAHPL